ncbi:MAG: tetratricopeptide repeat protein [Bradymonadia bacterium]
MSSDERREQLTPPPVPMDDAELSVEQTLDGDDLLDLIEEAEQDDEAMALDAPIFEIDEIEEDALEEIPPRRPRATLPPVPPPEARPQRDQPLIDEARRLAEAAEAELAERPGERRTLWLHRTLTRLYEVTLGDPRRALVHASKARTLDPHCQSTTAAQRRCLVALGRLTEALSLFDAEALIASNAEQQAAVLWAKATLLADRVGDLPEARRALERAHGLTPHDGAIHEARAWAAMADGDWETAAQAVGRVAERSRGASAVRATWLAMKAQIAMWRLEDHEQAIELYEQALELEGELPDGPRSANGAVDGLLLLLGAQGRWGTLVPALQARARWTTDPALKARIFSRIAQLLYSRFNDLDGALKTLEAAVELTPKDLELLAQLDGVCMAAGRDARLAEVIALQVPLVPEGERVAQLLRLAHLREGPLDDASGATAAYEEILTLDPLEITALEGLDTLYAAAGRWAELVVIRKREAEEAPSVTRQAIALSRVAEVYMHHLDDRAAAIEAFSAVLRRTPDHLGAFKALSRLYTLEGDHRALVKLNDAGVETAPTPVHRLQRLMRIAELYEGPLAAPAEALTAYRRVLVFHPHHLPAIHGVQRAGEAAGDESAWIEALDHEIAGTHTEYAPSDEGAPLAPAPGRQAELLVDSVRVLIAGGLTDRPEAAAQAVKRIELAQSLAPHDEAVLSVAAQVHRVLSRWRGLLQAWSARLPLIEHTEGKVALRFEMAHLAEHTLGDETAAIEHYRAVVELDGSHAGAIDALVRLYSGQSEWAKVVEVLEQALEGVPESVVSTQVRRHIQLARVHEDHLDALEQAHRHYSAVCRLMPAHPQGIDGVARVLGTLGRFEEMVTAIDSWIDQCAEVRWVVEARLLQASVSLHVLGDATRAIAAWRAVLELEPLHLGAHLWLAAHRRWADDFEGAAEHLEARCALDNAQGDTEVRLMALRAHSRVLALGGDEEGHQRRTIFEEVLDLAPGDPRALDALLTLALHGDRPDLMAWIGPQLADIAPSPLIVAEHWTSSGEAQEMLGRSESALEAYHRALAVDAEALAAVKGLVRVGRVLENDEVLAEGLRRQGGLTAGDVEAADLWVQSARLAIGPCQDTVQGAADLEAALDRCPAHEAAAELLVTTLVERGEGERLVHQLTVAARALDLDTHGPRIADLWLEIARIYADELRNMGAALTALRRLLKQSPDHLGGMLYTAEIYARDRQWSAAESALVQAVEGMSEQESRRVRLETLLKLTRLRAERLRNAAGALESAEAALSLKRDDRQALYWVARLEHAQGNLDIAVETAQRRVQASVAPADRVDALMQLARIELDRGGSIGGRGAAAALREAVVIEGPQGEAWTEYMKVVEAYDSWQAYAEALRRHLDSVATAEAPHTDRWLELARVRGERLGDPRGALEILDAARQLAPEHVPLKLESAQCLIDAQAYGQAVNNLAKLLGEAPRLTEGWSALKRAWTEGGQPQAAALTATALHVLGAPGGHPPTAGPDLRAIPAEALNGEALDTYAAEASEVRMWSQALALAAEGVSRARPAEPAALGINSRDRLSPRADHGLRQLVDTLTPAFGVSGFEVYLRPERGRSCQIALGKHPMIILDEGLSQAPMPVQVFRVGRIMAYLARGLHPAAALDTEALEDVFRALRRIGAPVAEPDAERLDDLLRRILKGTPRRNRRALEELGRALAGRRALDVGPWRDQVAVAHERVAAMLAGDLKAIVDRGGRRARDPKTTSALLAGWCDASAMHLRRRCGWV